jgi:hypothetical protein
MDGLQTQVVIPQSELPAAAPAPTAPALPPEIAYLREHGLEGEATSLQAELEGLLRSQDGAPAALPTAAPIAQEMRAPQPVQPTEAPPAPPAQTPQEKALDPYAVDGADSDDSPVVIDDQGRARDAQTGKYVPLKALHKERELHKQTRSENQNLRELNARVEERLAILNEILGSPDDKPAAEAPPADVAPPVEEFVDPEVDIFKSAKQMQDFIRKQSDYVKKLEEKISSSDTLTRAQLDEMNMQSAIRNDVTSFNSRNGDFLEAYKHLRTVRENALTALGYTDKAARESQLAREERGLAVDAVKNKKSYAEVLYNLAQAYGYSKPAPAPAPTPEPPAPAAPAAPAHPTVDPAAAAKVQALAQAKETAGPTLNGAGGAGGEGLTVAQLANMSDHDFLNLAAKLGGKAKMDEFLRRA